MAHYEADIELCDVLNLATKNGRLHSPRSTALFDFVDPARHPRLTNRQANGTNRKIAIAHLKATLYASFFKDMYEDLTRYLREILEAAALNGLDPSRLVGEHRLELEASEILVAGGWPEVVNLVADSVFRRLEKEKATKTLLTKMNSKLGLGVDLQKIEGALPYLEIRHLLVHCDGVADQEFCAAFPAVGAVAGKAIPLDFTATRQATKAILELVEEFDQKVVAHGIVAANQLQP
jgi:hypothetical protein